MSNNFEDLVTELFQHLELNDGVWHIEVDDSKEYYRVGDAVSEILDELEANLQAGPYVEEDTGARDPRPYFDED